MKKIILSLSAILSFAAIPAFSHTVQDKAGEINSAGKYSVQTQSATDARNIGNEVWDGSAKGGGTPSSESEGKSFDIIGGNNGDSRIQDKPSTFDKPEEENITPWSAEVYTMFGLLSGAFLMMIALSMIVSASCATNNPSQAIVAIVMAGIAAAMCAAALALAIVLIAKYKQTQLGIVWAIACTLAMTTCISAALAGVNAYKHAATNTYATIVAKFASIGSTLGLLFVMVPALGGLYKYSTETKQIKQEYCNAHPDHSDCQGYKNK